MCQVSVYTMCNRHTVIYTLYLTDTASAQQTVKPYLQTSTAASRGRGRSRTPDDDRRRAADY